MCFCSCLRLNKVDITRRLIFKACNYNHAHRFPKMHENVNLQHVLLPIDSDRRGYITCSGSFSSFLSIVVMCIVAVAALFSIHVGVTVLDAAAKVQNALAKLQTVLTVFYTFACKNASFNIFTPEDCQALCTVMDTACS